VRDRQAGGEDEGHRGHPCRPDGPGRYHGAHPDLPGVQARPGRQDGGMGEFDRIMIMKSLIQYLWNMYLQNCIISKIAKYACQEVMNSKVKIIQN